MVRPDPDRTQDSRQVELSSAAAELLVLRRAVETARDEARKANVSAHRAERALDRQRVSMEKALARERAQMADAKRLAQEWRNKYKAAEKWLKEYDRITSTIAWRLYSPFDRALYRARSILRPQAHPSDENPKPGSASDLHENFLGIEQATDPLDDNGREDHTMGNEEHAIEASVKQVEDGERLTEAEGKPEPINFDEGLPTEAASSPPCRGPDLSSLSALTPRGRIAVVLHLYYPELWPEFRDALGAIPEPFDLFVTLTAGYSDQAADWIHVDHPSAQIVTLENRGRDILPFVTLINSRVLFKYELVCKLHAKRSIQRNPGDTWRRDLVAGVLADADYVGRVLTAFDTDPQLGIVVGDEFFRQERDWSRHVHRINELCNRIGMAAVTEETGCPGYPAGSIYWIRSSLLRPIADLRLTAAEFEPEPLPRDGYKSWTTSCLVDAIERLMGCLCREAGMYIAEKNALGPPLPTPAMPSGDKPEDRTAPLKAQH